MLSNLLPQRIRHLRVETGRYAEPVHAIGADLSQALRIGYRKAPETDGINQLKDRSVCANAERERQDRNGGKYRSVSKRS
jgi:hypothetical protein